MEKLIIAGRTNWENKFYIKIKADKSVMKVINKLIFDFDNDDHFFLDEDCGSRSLSNYDKWKDEWIPVVTKDFGIDIICGDKMVHMIFYKFPNFDIVNKILNKYCDWAKVKYKKK